MGMAKPVGGQRDGHVLWSLSLASFLHDVGSDMVFSVWPLFVTQVLGANMAILGLIDGIGDAVVSVSGAVGGYLSDKMRKRKLFVWTGYLMGSIARIGYALSPSWPWLIPFRLLDRSGKIRSAPRDAIVSDISMRQNRASRFGILRAMDNFGAVTGILLAVILLPLLGYTNLFLVASIPSVIAVVLIVVTIRDPSATPAVFGGIRFRDVGVNLKLFTLASALFALGSFSYSFLLLFAKDYGFAATRVPLLYLVFTIVAAFVSIPAGKLADSIGRKKVVLLSYFSWIVVILAMLWFPGTTGILVAFMMYGLHKGALEPVQKTFVAELAPKEYTASTIGAFQMVIGLVELPASLITGLLWDSFSPSAAFMLSLALTTLSILLLLFVRED